MSADYALLAIVAVLIIGGGLLLLAQARKYRRHINEMKGIGIKMDLDDLLGPLPEEDRKAIMAGLRQTIEARKHQSGGCESPFPFQTCKQSGTPIKGNPSDELAAHEILDRIHCAGSMLQVLLLDRQDLPQPIRKQLDAASNTLEDAYQAMGKIRFNTDTTQGELK